MSEHDDFDGWEITRLLAHIARKLEHDMSVLSDAVDGVSQAITDLSTRLADGGSADAATIAQLEADKAAAQADIDSAVVALGNAKTALDAVAPAPVVAPPAAAQTLYQNVTGVAVDASQYTLSDKTAADGSALYTFVGDVNPGDANGVTADYTVYTPAP